MNKKAIALIFLFVFLLSFISAQDLAGRIDETRDNLENTREVVDEAKYNFLSDQWKEVFLQNKFVAAMDQRLQDINILFVVFFGRNYSLSLEMFLVLLMWLFTFLSLPAYFSAAPSYLVLSKKEGLMWLAALAGATLIAHLQLYNFLAGAAIKLMFYRSGGLWSFMTFIVIIVMIMIYFYFAKYIGLKIKATQKRNRDNGFEDRVLVLEAYKKGMSRADKI